jgi:hypothetical protein
MWWWSEICGKMRCRENIVKLMDEDDSMLLFLSNGDVS